MSDPISFFLNGLELLFTPNSYLKKKKDPTPRVAEMQSAYPPLWCRGPAAMAILKMPLILGVKVSSYRFRLGTSVQRLSRVLKLKQAGPQKLSPSTWPSSCLVEASCHDLPVGSAVGLFKVPMSAPSVSVLPLSCILPSLVTLPIIKTKPALIPPPTAGNILEAFHFTGSPVQV